MIKTKSYKIQPKPNSTTDVEKNKGICKSGKIKKDKLKIKLDNLRKSKGFRDLGDILYID